MKFQANLLVAIVAVVLGAGIAAADPVDLAVNGGFETGTFDGWSLFPTGDDQFTIITPGSEGDYAGRITNSVAASAALFKNANIGIDVVEPGETVTITFDARGTLAAGGVAFAEFFSELAGGGVSQAEILGGGPLALDADPTVWTSFSFTTTTGPDVSGGVTVQFTATTGGDPSSFAQVDYDNLSVIVEAPVATDATTWSGIKDLYR